jgi:hypothetical protein
MELKRCGMCSIYLDKSLFSKCSREKDGLQSSCKKCYKDYQAKRYVIKKMESQFKKGMTWENYGEWHLDHKIPLALAKKSDRVKKSLSLHKFAAFMGD